MVTSAFHAARSLNIFRKVFGKRYQLGVAAVRTSGNEDEQSHCAAHELASDSRSSREIFSMEDFADVDYARRPIAAGDDISIFYQLMLSGIGARCLKVYLPRDPGKLLASVPLPVLPLPATLPGRILIEDAPVGGSRLSGCCPCPVRRRPMPQWFLPVIESQ